MVIRRIREHVATHNWFAVAVDVLIVVLGVFLGTQVNNWNQDRLDGARAGDYRKRLVDELDFNARQYAQQIAYYRRSRDYGQAALAALEGRKALVDRDSVIAAYQLTQTDTTKTKTNVYDQMSADGLVDRLGDDELQQIATDFYLSTEVAQRSLQSIYPYRTMLREVMPYPLQMRIREACGDRNVYYKNRLVGVATVFPCRMTIPPAEAAQTARQLKSTPDIRRQMTRYLASIDEILDNLSVAHEQALAFRARLSGQTGSGPS